MTQMAIDIEQRLAELLRYHVAIPYFVEQCLSWHRAVPFDLSEMWSDRADVKLFIISALHYPNQLILAQPPGKEAKQIYHQLLDDRRKAAPASLILRPGGSKWFMNWQIPANW